MEGLSFGGAVDGFQFSSYGGGWTWHIVFPTNLFLENRLYKSIKTPISSCLTPSKDSWSYKGLAAPGGAGPGHRLKWACRKAANRAGWLTSPAARQEGGGAQGVPVPANTLDIHPKTSVDRCCPAASHLPRWYCVRPLPLPRWYCVRPLPLPRFDVVWHRALPHAFEAIKRWSERLWRLLTAS
jgi:hypothetical protein